MSSSSTTTSPPFTVPDGFKLHTENNAHILMSENEAFLNPVQEFNRDLSVACIRTWSEELNKAKDLKRAQARQKRASRVKEESAKKRQRGMSRSTLQEMPESLQPSESTSEILQAGSKEDVEEKFNYKITILEALSATGLRSIRYAKEIPLVKYVLANDLSSTAVAAMKRNVDLNGLGPSKEVEETGSAKQANTHLGKVRVNEGDACALMYSHRTDRVDVVDLDPYGTAAPFIDAAVQAVKDEGLLCITCTDLSILATNNYPEKCFSNYGGLPLKAEYSHEAALRLVLHAASTSASRYGRYIEPLLSLSIDFYVRLFIRVNSSPYQVKKALTKTSSYFVCTSCQSFYEQPLGRVVEKQGSGENVNTIYKTQPGPTVGGKCPECDSGLHIAGPMWSGPIHDTDFVSKVLQHTESHKDLYGTASRMQGMLTVAKEELHTKFYFTPTKIAGFFHCQTPSLEETTSALLHAGHQVSRSHASPGSLKTTGTCEDVLDVFRSWVKKHPVKNVSETSPSLRLLAKEPRIEANFSKHPKSVTSSSKVKIVRYPETPANWGPGSRPVTGGGNKRKRKHDN
ncbi:N2 N2-dimethylguanosine tRNA methyltransferase [Lentinula lateritia]|uniref:N2 N2-dimethylguanosine tRNA methyltransferase n=1 Tax=Lentinula aff. lateritia TaxID=2804960 RepID=A0ACC1U8P8_9AGAR|nr:N2 N2-dimethylguanosine tRNA methyltransferase [Lentinula aff. lateritia]KAJ3855892.1 N2 N2-dimethylguanosine tRNA methyltransferase [Lentinula lateritia]